MTIRHLRIFTKVYEARRITQAAEQLHMTQPAVSRAIQELEGYYGVKLFERIKRRLLPTECGRQTYAQARHILDAFDAIPRTGNELRGLIVLSDAVAYDPGASVSHAELLERVNGLYDLQLDIPDALKIIQLSEKNRRLVVISVQGLRRVNGSLLPEYTPEEFQEATFSFVKYYVQSRHYDELVTENEKLRRDLNSEIAWRNRVSDI